MKIVYRCVKCKSLDIECATCTTWVNMNTDEINGSLNEGPVAGIWCPICETHDTKYEEVPITSTVEGFIKAQSREVLERFMLEVTKALFFGTASECSSEDLEDDISWNDEKEWDSGSIEEVAEAIPQGLLKAVKKSMPKRKR